MTRIKLWWLRRRLASVDESLRVLGLAHVVALGQQDSDARAQIALMRTSLKDERGALLARICMLSGEVQ